MKQTRPEPPSHGSWSPRRTARSWLDRPAGGAGRWVISCVLVATAVGAAVRITRVAPPRIRVVVEPGLVRQETPGSRAFLYDLREAIGPGDDNEHPDRSSAILSEDEKPLGPAHSLHETIRREGGGRYSHWGSMLYFSSSDNTDPRANGRRYRLVIRRGSFLGRAAWVALAALSLVVLTLRHPGAFAVAVTLGPVALGAIGLTVATYFLIVEPPRHVDGAAAFESTLPLVLVVWAVAGAAVAWISRAAGSYRHAFMRHELRLEAVLSRGGALAGLLGLCLTLLLSWSPGAWRTPSASASPYAALLGEVPWSDAQNYYCGALRVSHTGRIDPWNQRRPINASFLALRLAAVDNELRRAMFLQVLFLAVAQYAAAAAAGARWGIWAGIGCYGILLGYARLCSNTTASEALGLSLGGIGFALLIRALDMRRPALAVLGLAGLSLALAARAGAMFVLPALVLWALSWLRSWHPRPARAVAWAVFGTSIGFVVSFGLVRLYSGGEALLGGNFAQTVLGLASDKTWAEAEREFQPFLQTLPSDAERSRFMFEKAWERMRERPGVLVGRLWRAERDFLSGFPSFFASLFASPPILQERRFPRLPPAAMLVLLSVSLAQLWRRGARHELRLWVAAAFGVLVSIPVIFFDGGWRILAPTWPFVAGLLSCALVSPGERHVARSTPRLGGQDILVCVSLVLFVVGVSLAPAAIPRWGSVPPESSTVAEHALLFQNWPGFPAVAVVDDRDRPRPHVPTVSSRDFPTLLMRSSMEDQASLLRPEPPAPPFVLGLAYDISGRGCRHFIGPLEMLRLPQARYLQVWVEPWRSSLYFDRVVDVRALP